MRIGVIADFATKENATYHSEESLGLLHNLARNHDVTVFNPYSQARTFGGDTSNALPQNMDVFYAGVLGKKIHALGQAHGLIQELSSYLKFFDANKGANFVNAYNTILSNLGKEYLLRMQQDGLPVIPTRRVQTLNDLLDAEKGMLAKPIISERGFGAVVLDTLTAQEKEAYFSQYQPAQGLFERQGMLLQPYDEGFRQHGERKISVVNGIETLSRINIATNDNKIVTYRNGAQILRYDPSRQEKDLIKEVWKWVQAHYENTVVLRLDITGDPKSPRINEVELVNPDHATMDNLHTLAEYKKHYTLLEEGLVDVARSKSLRNCA